MVKFWVDTKKGRILILGLSFADLERLKAGKFYVFDVLELGLTWQANILVFADETEEKIEETFDARFILHKMETGH